MLERRKNDVEVQQLRRRVTKIEKDTKLLDDRIDECEQDISVLEQRECPRLIKKTKMVAVIKQLSPVVFVSSCVLLAIIFGADKAIQIITKTF